MAIRTKQYKTRGRGKTVTVKAIRVTERNYLSIVEWIGKKGGIAFAKEQITPEGDVQNARVSVYQINHGKGHPRRGWRVALIGDFVVQYEDGSFARVKDDVFEATYQLA